MEYRSLPHGSERISVLGFGTSGIGMTGEKEIEAAMTMALENGINYFDMASADAAPFPAFGRAMAGQRKNIYFQIHFGADYSSGKYGWTTDLETIKRSVDWQLNALKTDYIDFGFLHCLDEAEDLKHAMQGGALDYILQLKKAGVVHHIGMSSHTPEVVRMALDAGFLDMLMFSINPAYDFEKAGEFAIGSVAERQALYRRCEAEGVGISVMKAFSGGQLLQASTSPFGRALTEYQCIQYALDKPGVLTVLPGVRNREDLHAGGAGLLRSGDVHAARGRRRVRVLQPLPAVSGWAGCGPDQQVLRSVGCRRCAGKEPLRQFGKARGRLRRLRALRCTLPVPCAPVGAHAGDPRVFRQVSKDKTANQ